MPGSFLSLVVQTTSFRSLPALLPAAAVDPQGAEVLGVVEHRDHRDRPELRTWLRQQLTSLRVFTATRLVLGAVDSSLLMMTAPMVVAKQVDGEDSHQVVMAEAKEPEAEEEVRLAEALDSV